MIQAEFAFMEHLSQHGVPVVAPIASVHGRLVEEVTTDDGKGLVVVYMTEAPGGRRDRSDWADNEIESYGSLLGSMHVAGESLADTGPRRPSWTAPIFDVGIAALQDDDLALFTRNAEIISAAAAHPAGADEMVIHQDAHLGNPFITADGQITMFDFDDSAYGTPTHDIAIVLYYWMLGRSGDPGPEVRRFLGHFLGGYRRHADLPTDWPTGADHFMSYREIDLYWLLMIEPEDEWYGSELEFMQGRRERILEGVPYLGVPLAELL